MNNLKMTSAQRIECFIHDKSVLPVLRGIEKALREDLRIAKNELDRAYCAFTSIHTPHQWAQELTIDAYKAQIATINKRIARNEFLKLRVKGKEFKQSFDIDQIKQIPCGDYMTTQCTYDTETQAKYLCPLHDEKTASFIWNKQKNRWKCFGCGEGGSVIDLVMKLNDLDFVKACKYLST